MHVKLLLSMVTIPQTLEELKEVEVEERERRRWFEMEEEDEENEEYSRLGNTQNRGRATFYFLHFFCSGKLGLNE